MVQDDKVNSTKQLTSYLRIGFPVGYSIKLLFTKEYEVLFTELVSERKNSVYLYCQFSFVTSKQ